MDFYAELIVIMLWGANVVVAVCIVKMMIKLISSIIRDIAFEMIPMHHYLAAIELINIRLNLSNRGINDVGIEIDRTNIFNPAIYYYSDNFTQQSVIPGSIPQKISGIVQFR